jgi:DNA (cytosine-5)-methyltransferase 1
MVAGKKQCLPALQDNVIPTFIDVFAGCGGLSLGLMSAGWKGLFAVEKNADAFQTLSANLVEGRQECQFAWPRWLPKKPLTLGWLLRKYRQELNALSGRVDMVVGGPPCQGFSSAGRRDPSDPRNELVRSYLTLVRVLKPKLVLIENVRGITADFADERAKSGTRNYAKWIIDSLSPEYQVHSQTLDLSQFGVPQKRQRFFVIAVRNDIAREATTLVDPFKRIEDERQLFLRSKGLFSVPVSAKSAISDFEISKAKLRASQDTEGFQEIVAGVAHTSFQKLMTADSEGPPPDTRLARHGKDIADRFRHIIKVCHAEGRLNTSISPELRASFGLRKCAIRVLDPDAPSPTITSMPDDLIHYKEPRTLTVRENARLQSFPDWFKFKGKYTTGGLRRKVEVPRFTQVANAVPPLAAEAIGLSLLNSMTEAQQTNRPSKKDAAPQRALDSQASLNATLSFHR